MKPAEFEPVESEPGLHRTTGAAESARGEVIEMVPLVFSLKNILVPIDFSDTSRKALQYAVPFAKQFEAKITLLHVVDLPMYPQEFGYLLVDESQALDNQKKCLADLAGRTIPPELLAQTIVRRGVSWDTVVAVARETQADLIITTTHGYTGLKHVLMGSTAERIVRHAPCPVLVVREREHEFA
jgi:nucleotide-binding universal stress UspA family protein